MRGAWPALGVVLALAACGRLGFQAGPGDDDADLGDTITLVVTSDEYLSEPAGLPIRDATVLVDRGGDVLERTSTDDTGTVQFAASGAVAYHVVYPGDRGWRVYTAEAPRPGTFELGGRTAFNLNRSMTVTVPAGPGTGLYALRVPEQCAIPGSSSTPAFTFSFNPACEGRAVRMVAFSRTDLDTASYLDAGMVTLVDGATHNATGTYQPATAVAIEVSNLPGGVIEVGGDVVARAGADLTSLLPFGLAVFPQGTSATVMNIMAAGGNAVRVDVYLDLVDYASTVSHIRPATVAATTRLDVATLLPPFTSLTFDRLPVLSWTGGSSGGSWIAVEAITGMLQWNAYVSPSATSVTFPALPADLGVPTPSAFDVVLVTKLDVPGVTAEDLARRFDRSWNDWPHLAELLPAEGSSRAQIRYIAP